MGADYSAFAGARLRIAVDGDGLSRPQAGVGVYTREILRALAAAAPVDLTVYGPPGIDLPPGVTAARRSTIPFAGRHLLWSGALRRTGADVFFGCIGQLPLRGVGMPSVVTAHDLAIYRNPEWFPDGQWLSVQHVVPRSLRRADRVICVSHSTARDVEALLGVPHDRLRVVPLGVDGAFSSQSAEAIADVRRRLDLPERFILFVSTIEPRKNLPVLLDAWSHLDDRPALVVAGLTGWRAREIEAKLEGAGGEVRRLGPVDRRDLPALYSAALCLCHPSWYEGFGLTPLEAMACGTPVVVSSRSSLPEVVGDAGLLIDPADPDAWTAALAQVLTDDDLRQELRTRGLARAASFTWSRTAEETWAVMQEVVGKS
ncbi:MAG: glycosyltransferase family 4 protein [Candidatus Dormibacteraeota bacterium]|nr:glycosyltransferase family 4 protein [Candidatus Dormibacteraeota bacterium]